MKWLRDAGIASAVLFTGYVITEIIQRKGDVRAQATFHDQLNSMTSVGYPEWWG